MKIKTIFTAAFLACIMAFSNPSFCTDDLLLEQEKPGFGMMTLDLLVARPLSLVATIAGTAIYVVSLPLSYAGGNHEEAANVLVRPPAYHTFKRCLGCSTSQALDQIERQERFSQPNQH